MKIASVIFLPLFLAFFLTNCVTTGTNADIGAFALDEVLEIAVENLEEKIVSGSTLAILNFTSSSESYSEYIIEELTMRLVNSKKLIIVDRKRLDLIRGELQFQLSGEVSDESAQRIGVMLGAQFVIIGSITEISDFYRFRINAINVETAVIESAISLNINKKDTQTAWLLQQPNPPKPISLSLVRPETTMATIVQSGRNIPAWVDAPYSVYDSATYFVSVGSGQNHDQAMQNATNNLSAIFGVNVQVSTPTSMTYSEAIMAGNYEGMVTVRNRLDYIIGAEIKEVWDNSRGTVYALATLNKNIAIEQYTRLLDDNVKILQELTNMSASKCMTFDDVACFYQAAYIADVCQDFLNVLIISGGDTRKYSNLMKKEDYNSQALDILAKISISINVVNDQNGRINNAFVSSLNQVGLRKIVHSNTQARYLLSVNIHMLNSGHKITADLIDSSDNSIFYHYIIENNNNDRNRSINVLEARIREDFYIKFGEYLISYIPNY
jgi:TolB-like protein